MLPGSALVLGAVAALAALSADAAQCDLSQEVEVGKYYDITNPNYPNNYKRNTKCRWRATTVPDARLQLSCGQFDIPASKECRKDKVLVSTSGDDSLADAHVYCGKGAFSQVSDANKLTMALRSSRFSRGGRFLCNITANYPPCTCGIKKESRIVGGEYTGVNEYPFMAALVDSEIKMIICGASLLSDHYALTAAHCVYGREPLVTGLLVGDHNISTGEDTKASKLYKVKKFEVHPGYKDDPYMEYRNDIALVRVDSAVAMSREVMPVCLPFRFRADTFADDMVEVLGWGTTEFGGATSDTLRKTDLRILPPASCTAAFNFTDSSQQICSFNKGKDSCQMDSGGPLYWQEASSQREYIVGIVSFGVACATDAPSVNTRVTFYLDWITSVIGKEDQYCIV